jgi:hypothetical protein
MLCTVRLAEPRSQAVSEWEYRKIPLNGLPRETDDIDALNNAGSDGWELVAILPNNVAYLKRERGSPVLRAAEDTKHAVPSAERDADANKHRAGEGDDHVANVKYRDPKTNETWSGRGRMANWLKRKQDAGEDIDEYLV